MKVLVVGGGGREHALAWKLNQSPKVDQVLCAPGNPGTSEIAHNVPLSSDDLDGLANFARKESIDLTVIGPEAPLVAGVVDLFASRGLPIFGPSRACAQLEGSKHFAKTFMEEFGIPTARSKTFEDLGSAVEYVKSEGAPLVIKADGLAAGKGVTVARDVDTAIHALRDCFETRVFGEAGARVVIEEFMEGEEASVLAVCDGRDFLSLPSSQDHKPVFDGDRGPNTGGMGAYSPAPILTEEIARRVDREILAPVLEGMQRRGTPYKGILYAGLMITKDGPRVVEFNCRMGDPETQAVLPVLKSDLFNLFLLASQGRLSEHGPLQVENRPAVCVVLASGGYPGAFEKGKSIRGLEPNREGRDMLIFHAGTRLDGQGDVVTSGGRVLGVVGRGDSIAAAAGRAYEGVKTIHFDGMHFRKDIARKAIDRL